MAERTNTDRAERALRALTAYDIGCALLSSESTDRDGLASEALSDLLCDLRHLADRLGVDYGHAAERGERAHAAEMAGSEAGDWAVAQSRAGASAGRWQETTVLLDFEREEYVVRRAGRELYASHSEQEAREYVADMERREARAVAREQEARKAEQSATSDRLLLAALEVAAEEIGPLADWRVVVDGVAAGEWPATSETRCWGTAERFATYHAEQAGAGEPVQVRRLGDVRVV